MKVLFLDIDGVLNSKKSNHQIDPATVARLNRITDTTGAAIVVTSTRRIAFIHSLDRLQAMMKGYGVTGHVAGITPDLVVATDGQILLAQGHRGDEITAWLDDNNVIRFAILDDQSVYGLNNYLIQTNFDDGLQDSHVDQAITLLGVK